MVGIPFLVRTILGLDAKFYGGDRISLTSAITMCAQPLGQMIYGFLFDGCREAVYLVLILTGIAVGLIGVGSAGFSVGWRKNRIKGWKMD